MKILTIFLAALSVFVGGTYGELKCNVCDMNVETLEVVECKDTTTCEAGVESCETIIVKDNGTYSVVFGCSVNRCKTSDDEFKSCKDSGVCFDCCNSDNCNAKADLPTIFGSAAAGETPTPTTTTTAPMNKQAKINAVLEALENINANSTAVDNATATTNSSDSQVIESVTNSTLESNQNLTTIEPKIQDSVNQTSNSSTTLATPESTTVGEKKPKPPVYPEDEDTLEVMDDYMEGNDKNDEKSKTKFENVDTLEDVSKTKGEDGKEEEKEEKKENKEKEDVDDGDDLKDDLSKPKDELEEDIETTTEKPLLDDHIIKSKEIPDPEEKMEAKDDDAGGLFGLGDAADPKNKETDEEGNYFLDEGIANIDQNTNFLDNVDNSTTTEPTAATTPTPEPSSATNHFTILNTLLVVVLVLIVQLNF